MSRITLPLNGYWEPETKQLTVSPDWYGYHMTGKPQFRCYLPPTMMDPHSIPKVELHNATWQKASLHTLRQIELHQILLQSHTHQMHYYRCREQIHSSKAPPITYQTEKHQNMKLSSFSTSNDYCINMSWTKTRSSWLLSYLKHGNTQCSWNHMTNMVIRELLIHTAS